MARLLKLPHEVITMIDSFARTPWELEFMRIHGAKFNATKRPMDFPPYLWDFSWGAIPEGVTRHAWAVDSSAISSLVPGVEIAIRCALGIYEAFIVSVQPPCLVLEPRDAYLGGTREIDFSTIVCVWIFVDMPIPNMPRVGPEGFTGDLDDGPMTEAEGDALDALGLPYPL